MKTCYYCHREGSKQFVSLFLGDCTFEGKKRKKFTLVQCSNRDACDKRKAKLTPKNDTVKLYTVDDEGESKFFSAYKVDFNPIIYDPALWLKYLNNTSTVVASSLFNTSSLANLVSIS